MPRRRLRRRESSPRGLSRRRAAWAGSAGGDGGSGGGATASLTQTAGVTRTLCPSRAGSDGRCCGSEFDDQCVRATVPAAGGSADRQLLDGRRIVSTEWHDAWDGAAHKMFSCLNALECTMVLYNICCL